SLSRTRRPSRSVSAKSGAGSPIRTPAVPEKKSSRPIRGPLPQSRARVHGGARLAQRRLDSHQWPCEEGRMPRAVVIHATGGPEVLTIERHDPGLPAAGAVRVRVHAAGVNFIDVYFRTGLYP